MGTLKALPTCHSFLNVTRGKSSRVLSCKGQWRRSTQIWMESQLSPILCHVGKIGKIVSPIWDTDSLCSLEWKEVRWGRLHHASCLQECLSCKLREGLGETYGRQHGWPPSSLSQFSSCCARWSIPMDHLPTPHLLRCPDLGDTFHFVEGNGTSLFRLMEFLQSPHSLSNFSMLRLPVCVDTAEPETEAIVADWSTQENPLRGLSLALLSMRYESKMDLH